MLSSVTRRGCATGRAVGRPGLTAPPRAQTGKAAGIWAGAVGFQRAPPERRTLSRGPRTGRVPLSVKLIPTPREKAIAGKHPPTTPQRLHQRGASAFSTQVCADRALPSVSPSRAWSCRPSFQVTCHFAIDLPGGATVARSSRRSPSWTSRGFPWCEPPCRGRGHR